MLQIFTYSTGLALTGRSAACAPATATRPAAEPRRRLFTIFIVTSKFAYRGRVRSSGAETPWKVPSVPRESTRPFISHHSDANFRTWTGRPGDAPLRRTDNLNQGTCTHNEKTAESQGRTSLFSRVLHKWHLGISPPPTPWPAPEYGMIYQSITTAWRRLFKSPGGLGTATNAPSAAHQTGSGGRRQPILELPGGKAVPIRPDRPPADRRCLRETQIKLAE